VRKHQIDWKNGEWWSDVNASLQGRGDKGGLWKAAYHNGRAMIECLALLKELEKAK
jgi:mannobiose 2-epimerase